MPVIDSKKRNMFMTPFSREQRKCLSGVVANQIVGFKTNDTLIPLQTLIPPTPEIPDPELIISLEANTYYKVHCVYYLSTMTPSVGGRIGFCRMDNPHLPTFKFLKAVARVNYQVPLSSETESYQKIDGLLNYVVCGLSVTPPDPYPIAYSCEISATMLSDIPIDIAPTYFVPSMGVSNFVLAGSNIVATPLDFINSVT